MVALAHGGIVLSTLLSCCCRRTLCVDFLRLYWWCRYLLMSLPAVSVVLGIPVVGVAASHGVVWVFRDFFAVFCGGALSSLFAECCALEGRVAIAQSWCSWDTSGI